MMTDGFPLVPRDYQRAAVDEIGAAQKAGGKRVVLYGPTGCGKTVIAELWADEHRDRRMMFVVDRKTLIRQTARRFIRDGLDVGIIQAQNTRATSARCLITSAQTLASRPRLVARVMETVDDLWWDECHLYRNAVDDAASRVVHRGGFVVGMSATPFNPQLSGWDRIVSTCSTKQLQDRGDLVPVEAVPIWAPPDEELKTARRGITGEWQDGEIERIVTPHTAEIAAAVAAALAARDLLAAPGIAFASTIAHAEAFAAALSTATGRRWVAVSDKTTDRAMARIIYSYEQGSITGLVSVAKLAVGFDHRAAQVCILNRALSRSFSEHLQEVGRVLRSFEGKDRAVILDAAGNWGRFLAATEQIWADGVHMLPRPRLVDARVWFCRCSAENPISRERCATCGAVKRHPEAIPEPKKCSRCGAPNAGSAPVCAKCFAPFTSAVDSLLDRCARHGLLLEDDGRGGTVCPMPGCDVAQPAELHVEIPAKEPLRTIFIIACRSADRRGESGATKYLHALHKALTGERLPRGIRAVAGTRASYAITDPKVERWVERRNKARILRMGRGRANHRTAG